MDLTELRSSDVAEAALVHSFAFGPRTPNLKWEMDRDRRRLTYLEPYYRKYLRHPAVGLKAADDKGVLQGIAVGVVVGVNGERREPDYQGPWPNALLVSICVRPESQGTGVGSKLLAGWEAAAAALGAKGAGLITDEDGIAAEMRFYERHGWHLVRRFTNQDGGRMLRYSRPLDIQRQGTGPRAAAGAAGEAAKTATFT